ncbi:MEDS domain-containing protein [Patescibacteria group bacterium]|nr:MEDS domain-containing protein [Patescibacteria group bacterium]MBU4512836.1 MEDS domain-containing protein [Patescibacteria group bacterium]MCG2688182.1 MEDS domain-containing protein [Candidatus Parcubacteria bacterium]
MKEKNRKTGIDIIGDMPWGTHLCLFYQTKEDLVDILVPYFKAGLENNEFCMWVCWNPLQAEEARTALSKTLGNLDNYIKKGQIEIVNYSKRHKVRGDSGFSNMKQFWIEKEKLAFERGFEGLRLAGNTYWLERNEWKDFAKYEEEVDSIIKGHKMLAICPYSLDKCGASEIIDVIKNHQFALIKREGKWELIESSEHKKAEKALRESEQRFKDLTESTTDWVWEVDKDGMYTYASPKVKELLGYEVSEVLGKTPFDLMPKEEAEKIGKFFTKKVIKREPFYRLENINRHKDGHLVVLETSGIPLFNEKGQLKGYRGIDRDITDRKRSEEEKMKAQVIMLAEQKKKVLAEKMAEELKKEVARKTQKIREAHELRERFIADASHELRTPLTVLQTKMDLLSSTGTSKGSFSYQEVKDCLESGKNQIKNLTTILEELTLFSRGKKPKEFREKIKLGTIVREVAKELRALAEAKNINYKIKILDQDLVIKGDKEMLKKLVRNLIFNAIKYGREKGKIEIILKKQKREAELRVADGGVGISKKDLPHIFERFYRTGKGRSREKGGAGLGLAICKWIVEQHGGEIKVESEYKKGSNFIVSLPLESGIKK